MDRIHTLVLYFVIFLIQLTVGDPGVPVAVFPAFELRTIGDYSAINTPFQLVNRNVVRQQQLQHTNPIQPLPFAQIIPTTETPHDAQNSTFNDIMEVFNSESNKEQLIEKQEHRAADHDHEHPSHSGPNEYFPGFGTWPPYPGASVAPSIDSQHTSSPKAIELLKPVMKPSTKVASKVSGFLNLILALLSGSSSNNLELNGFKDIIINGIVKPLLVAKGGIKTLVSKLTIPLISLMLINLEILITVWWLWDDCPQVVPSPPPYQPPPYSLPNYSPPHYPYSKPSYRLNPYQ